MGRVPAPELRRVAAISVSAAVPVSHERRRRLPILSHGGAERRRGGSGLGGGNRLIGRKDGIFAREWRGLADKHFGRAVWSSLHPAADLGEENAINPKASGGWLPEGRSLAGWLPESWTPEGWTPEDRNAGPLARRTGSPGQPALQLLGNGWNQYPPGWSDGAVLSGRSKPGRLPGGCR